MKNTLSYEKILGFRSFEFDSVLDKLKLKDKNCINQDIFEEVYSCTNTQNLKIKYKIKGKKQEQILNIPRNENNYNGVSIKLPNSCEKVQLQTKIKNGVYNNTWVVLQNRTNYTPKLEVNGKKYSPTEVNGAYIRYSFTALNPDIEGKEAQSTISIHTDLNTNSGNCVIVGVWFD
jgi:hypothetical protein